MGGYFIVGGAAMYGNSSFFDFIAGLDQHVAADPVFGFIMSVMDELVNYGLWLVLFGLGYVFLGIYLERLLQQALWLHIAISVCMIIWGVLCYLHFLPMMGQFYAMIPMPEANFLETWNKMVVYVSVIAGAVQFVIPQFFLGRMIWKKQQELAGQ